MRGRAQAAAGGIVQDEIRSWSLPVLALLGAFVLCSRFVDGLLHAELWGDDGWTFYPQAYQLGLRSLLIPVNGYLNTAQRLGSIFAVSARIPLADVPTLFALIALAAQLGVAVFLVGPRLAKSWPDQRGRVAGAFLYLALPNSAETFGNLTNIQWHLSLLAFMILMAPANRAWLWRSFDAIVLVLSGLSGPFCIMQMPIALYQLWNVRRQPADRAEAAWRTALLLLCALVQLGVLLFDNAIRHAGGFDTFRILVRVISLQIVLGLFVGLNTIVPIANSLSWRSDLLPYLITFAAALFMVTGFVRGNRLLRSFCVFCAILFAGELASPVVRPGGSPWQLLMTPWACQRYFMIPMLGLGATILSFAGQRSRIERLLGYTCVLVIALWSIPHDWSYPDLGQTDFVARADAFASAPPGTTGVFPIHPAASTMVLVKRAR